jgi:hypothetical protein
VAGIAGWANNSSTTPIGMVEDCVNEGSINGSGSEIAGIVGFLQGTCMKNCRNSGTVSAPDGRDVAGIVARSNVVEITQCENHGNITGKEHVAGVLAVHGSGTLPLSGCYNTGNITGEQQVGGIYGSSMGYGGGTNMVEWSTTGGAGGAYPSPLFVGCFNTGEVTGKLDVGGVAYGKYTSAGCFYIKGKVHSEDHKVIEVEEGAQGVTPEQLKSHVVVNAMNVGISNSFSKLGNHFWHFVQGGFPSYYEPAGGDVGVYYVNLSVSPFGVPVEIDGIRFNTKAAGMYRSITLPAGDYKVKLGDYSDDTQQTCHVNPHNSNIISLNTGITSIPKGSGKIYQLYTPEHVHLMRYANYSEFELMNDIVFESKHDFSLTEGNFYPIWRFGGSINGKGYAIRNLNIRGDSLDCVGLFETLENYGRAGVQDVGWDSKISNLRLENITVKGRKQVGAIAGNATTSFRGNQRIHTIDSCFVSGVIAGVEDVGGFCGRTDYLISNSVNEARVSGEKYIGGISGYCNAGYTNNTNKGEISGIDGVGGLAGGLGGVINNCRNFGKISGHASIGGITGGVGQGSIPGTAYSTAGSIANSFNAGGIYASGAGAIAGGIAGSYSGSYYAGSRLGWLQHSFNIGTLTVSGDNAYAGGLIGISLADSIIACYNAGEIKGNGTNLYAGGLIGGHRNYGVVISAYNAGEIKADGSNSSVGSLFGSVDNNTTPARLASMFPQVYYLQDEAGNINPGIPATGVWTRPSGEFPPSLEARTVEQMRHPGFLSSLNSVLNEPAWKADLTPNINNGFPILIGQTQGVANGIKPVNPASPANVYVNVTNGILTIQAEDFRSAIVYDISCRPVGARLIAPLHNVSQFPQGVYIVWIETGKGIYSQKVLIK